MNDRAPVVEFIDLEPKSNILKEVLVGLSKSQKMIEPKFLYDKKGSEIFEKICKLPEYYPSRTELSIYRQQGSEMARLIGDDALVIEPGSGNGSKFRMLLPHLRSPAGYVPIEISREILIRMTSEFLNEFPDLKVTPVCADFTTQLDLPLSLRGKHSKKVIFFPGSTIGNFHPDEALNLLKSFSRLSGKSGGLLVGVDLKKDPKILERAYDDSAGVTAAFNLNLLERLNRETDAAFELENFSHKAFYNEEVGRVEMHLESRVPQLVRVHGTMFRFSQGETIHTECSYKYSIDEFSELAARAKYQLERVWTDPAKLFAVYYFSH